MARAPNKDEEQVTDVDVNVERPPSVTISVQTTAPGLSGSHLSPVSSLSPELSSLLPADSEPQTLERSDVNSKAPLPRLESSPDLETYKTNLSLITPRLQPLIDPNASSSFSSAEATDNSLLSLITPRLEPIGMVRAELAIANGPDAAEIQAVLEQGTRSAEEEEEEEEEETQDDDDDTGTTRRQRVPENEEEDLTVRHKEDETLLGRVEPGAIRVRSPIEDDETIPKAELAPAVLAVKATLSAQEAAASAFANLADLPPIRPRLDSEAAGHWPPWHAAEARAGVGALPSPISSGTEALPRAVVQAAFAQVRPENRPPEPERAKLEQAATMLQMQIQNVAPSLATGAAPSIAPNQPLNTPPRPLAPPILTPAQPHQHFSPSPVDSISDAAAAAGPAPSSKVPGRAGKKKKRSGMSPLGAFLIAFILFGALFGGLAAVRYYGWPGFISRAAFGGASTQATATPPPVATQAPSTEPSASASAPAAPVASASASAAPIASTSPSASSSSGRTKPAGSRTPRTRRR